jgi:hypothetical protein
MVRVFSLMHKASQKKVLEVAQGFRTLHAVHSIKVQSLTDRSMPLRADYYTTPTCQQARGVEVIPLVGDTACAHAAAVGQLTGHLLVLQATDGRWEGPEYPGTTCY